jgi:cation:H+ antiporter
MQIIQEFFILILAFLGIWIGAGLIINSVEKLAGNLKHSSFLISFFVLGFFTSMTEITVAINSVIEATPQISAGNLMGGVIVLLLMVIPLLGIFGKGIKLDHSFGSKGVLFCILFFLTPFLLLFDSNLSQIDGYVLIIIYCMLSIFLFAQDKKSQEVSDSQDAYYTQNKLKLILLIIFGVTILIISSNFLVDEIISIASYLEVTPFIISLLALSIGTNLPEITLAIRSVIQGKTQIALGNYLGSSVFNIFILGILAVISGGFATVSSFFIPLIISLIGFSAFYLFMKSNDYLSRKESIILFLIYVIFVLVESLVYF